jgi:hypothetical protein
MSILKFFRRRSPRHLAVTRPAVDVSTKDRLIAAYHGLTPEQWDDLPAIAKQDLRESVAWELRAAS